MTFRACADPASRIPTESGIAPFRRGMVWAQKQKRLRRDLTGAAFCGMLWATSAPPHPAWGPALCRCCNHRRGRFCLERCNSEYMPKGAICQIRMSLLSFGPSSLVLPPHLFASVHRFSLANLTSPVTSGKMAIQGQLYFQNPPLGVVQCAKNGGLTALKPRRTRFFSHTKTQRHGDFLCVLYI